jgi:5-methylcytosine-specific restriction endonuclease McrA
MQRTNTWTIADWMEWGFNKIKIPFFMLCNLQLALPWLWSVNWHSKSQWDTFIAFICPIFGTFCVFAAYEYGRRDGIAAHKQRVTYRYIVRGTQAEKTAKKRYMSQRRSQFGKLKAARVLALIERDGYICRYCGSQKNLEIDHIVPLSKGGGDALKNLQFLCPSCNRRKNDQFTDPQPERVEAKEAQE